VVACHAWLSADFFVSHGYHLESVDGRRWAVRGSERHGVLRFPLTSAPRQTS
jgi:hypothetical protein